jgi:hypothetical protein
MSCIETVSRLCESEGPSLASGVISLFSVRVFLSFDVTVDPSQDQISKPQIVLVMHQHVTVSLMPIFGRYIICASPPASLTCWTNFASIEGVRPEGAEGSWNIAQVVSEHDQDRNLR